jgi:hypothetical protein
MWGNPFGLEEYGRQLAVDNYRRRAMGWKQIGALDTALNVSFLRGKDLACWCPLCEKHKDGKPLNEVCNDCPPCHADVLLEIANK